MSLLDRVRSFFSKGTGGAADDEAGRSADAPRAGESSTEASLGAPPVLDPLGTPPPRDADDGGEAPDSPR